MEAALWASALLPQLVELLPRARVRDVGLRQPASARLRDGELDVTLGPDLVRIGVEHELESRLLRRARMDIAEVEAVRLAVHLEKRPRGERALDDALDVDVARRALVDPPPGEVADAVDIRVRHRLEHALGGAVVRRVVNRRDDPVEPSEILVGHVHLAVRTDVGLDAGEDRQLREALAERLDLLELRVEAAVAEVVRVVGDRVVLVAARDRRLEHLRERVLAVGRPVRVRVEVATDVLHLDELRQLTRPRRLELAGVLPQLRGNRLVAEVLVDRVLVRGLEDLARLRVRDAVLGDRQTAPHRVLAHRDVVVLRAGEVLEEVAERLRRHDAEVEAETVARDDRRLRVAVRRYLDDPRHLDEVRGQLRRIGRTRDHVEVAERLLPPPHRTGLGHGYGRGQLL